MFKKSSLATFAIGLAACSGGMDTTSPGPTKQAGAALHSESESSAGAVYALNNSAVGNAVLVFSRAADGTLTPAASVSAGGNGTGAGTGSQGAIALSEDGHMLFAVNAGSNTIASFSARGTSLSLVGTVSSGGTTPISLTLHDGVLYVLNGGGSGNIVGFNVSSGGTLSMIPGSSRALSGSGVGPAEVGFDPSGQWLVVTEKNTNFIDVYRVGDDGVASAAIVSPSAGKTPFGFAFNHEGSLVVSEAFGGAAGASAASSYVIEASGHLQNITASAATTQGSACWVTVTGNGKFAYTSNTGSASVTGFGVRNATLSILDANGRTGETGAAPADGAVSRNSQNLYVLDGGSHDISVFRVSQSNGSLTKLASVGGLPAGTIGLAAQ